MSEIVYSMVPYISRRQLNTNYIVDFHKHDCYELYYMLEGSTTYFIEEEFFIVNQGNFVIVPKSALHKTNNSNCLNNDRILISFSDASFTPEVKQVLDELCSEKLIHIPTHNVLSLEDLLHKIINEHEQPKKNSDILTNIYIMELISLLSRYKLDSQPKYDDTQKIILSVFEYIKENFTEDISLVSLSRRFNLSKSFLSKKFKDITDIGIKEYITYMRMTHAKKLLKTTDLSITEIAHMCGYNDSNYFSSVFKATYGMPPLKFAKKYK